MYDCARISCQFCEFFCLVCYQMGHGTWQQRNFYVSQYYIVFIFQIFFIYCTQTYKMKRVIKYYTLLALCSPKFAKNKPFQKNIEAVNNMFVWKAE
jgi:hypothetical protein